MRVDQMFPSKFLRAADVPQGKFFTLTIASVTLEDVGTENASDVKPVMYFKETQKGMVLNKTNAHAVEWAYGPETDTWPGNQVELFTEMTMFQGRPTPGLRLRKPGAMTAATVESSGVQKSMETMSRPVAPSEASGAPGVADDLDDKIPF